MGALVSSFSGPRSPTFDVSTLGILTQLAIVSGIMLTQVAGLNLATPSLWRYVFYISACLAIVQLFFTSMIVESPAFLLRKNRLDDYKTAVRRLWGNTVPSLECKGVGIPNGCLS